MKTKIDFANIARLVSGLLAVVFIFATVVYCIGVLPDVIELIGYYIEDYAYDYAAEYIWNVLANFLYPLVLLASAVLIALYGFLPKKCARLLSVSAILYAVSSLLISACWLFEFLPNAYDITEVLIFTVYLVITLMYVPIIISSYKQKPSLLSKILGLTAFVMHLASVVLFSNEIQLAYASYSNSSLVYFHLITPVVPLVLSLLIAFCPKTFDSNIEEVQGQEQI